jgi:hypothetical protein
MNSSPLGSVLFMASSLLLPPAVAGPTVGDALITADDSNVDSLPSSWEMLRRAPLAPGARASVGRASSGTDAVSLRAREPTSVGHGGARSPVADAGEKTCVASGGLPGVHLALRVVAQQFGAPVTQLLDEYQAYRSSWQGRD